MEKYHFCIVDGDMIEDPEGTDLMGPSEAKVEAARLMLNYVRDKPGEVWEEGSITVWVTDHMRVSLFRLDLFLTDCERSSPLLPSGPFGRFGRRSAA